MFDPEKLYPSDDPEVNAIFPRSTLASWRCENRGPAWSKWGKRCFYRGSDLNDFIASRRRETEDSERIRSTQPDFAA